jgi:hypothetical protein
VSRDDCREWIFTFGYGHVHPETGESLAERFVRIPGTYSDARREMARRFGMRWAFQYEAEADTTQYGRELPLTRAEGA